MFRFTFRLDRTVIGVIAVGMAVAVSSFTVVRAERAQPAKSVSYSCSTGPACVEGSSTGASTWGVYGTATKSDGVHGVTSTTTGASGVAGIATATSGKAHGVYGSSKNGNGVYGQTSSSKEAAVYGKTLSGSVGVYGEGGSYGTGIYGDAQVGTGVYGYSTGTGVGVYGIDGGSYGLGVEGVGATAVMASGGLYGLYATANSGGYPIDSGGYPSGGSFYTNYAGDGTFSGTVTATGFKTAVRRRDGSRVIASASLAPRATIEDTGTARLTDGVGIVHLETDYASMIDTNKGYQVFLTPDGDTRGWLYVAAKYEGGFVVREAEHGRSSIYFDYRVLAHPSGSSDERFPTYNPKQPTRPNLPAHSQLRLPDGG